MKLTDPATLRAAVQAAAWAALGRGLSLAQIDEFVTQFQATETTAQGGSPT